MIKTFSGRSPLTAELLKDATGRKADITFDREYTLDLGGVRVRFLVVGPTHTRGDTGFFVEGDGVLFAGDVVMNNSFVAANQASSMKAWLAAFDAFEAMKPRTDRARARRRRRRVAHRDEPRDHAGRAGARARAQGAGPFGRRDGHSGADGDPGETPDVAPRQRLRPRAPRTPKGRDSGRSCVSCS